MPINRLWVSVIVSDDPFVEQSETKRVTIPANSSPEFCTERGFVFSTRVTIFFFSIKHEKNTSDLYVLRGPHTIVDIDRIVFFINPSVINNIDRVRAALKTVRNQFDR